MPALPWFNLICVFFIACSCGNYKLVNGSSKNTCVLLLFWSRWHPSAAYCNTCNRLFHGQSWVRNFVSSGGFGELDSCKSRICQALLTCRLILLFYACFQKALLGSRTRMTDCQAQRKFSSVCWSSCATSIPAQATSQTSSWLCRMKS